MLRRGRGGDALTRNQNKPISDSLASIRKLGWDLAVRRMRRLWISCEITMRTNAKERNKTAKIYEKIFIKLLISLCSGTITYL
uniref:Uncharacterized protein n=1 Tax=Eubacterium cellulosolvens (strain ATCC 43171 / JCM 9499 / 6) TaxID=633697 RepID=I5ARS6_EUBC6